MARYEVAFAGQLVPGAQLEQVKANLMRLFQADEQRIALLFSGRRMVIKTNLEEAAAQSYRVALAKAGAVVEVAALTEHTDAPAPAPAPAPANSAIATQSAVGRLNVAPRDEYMAAFIEVDAPDFGLAPVGADLQDQTDDAQAPVVDLSAFSLAPVGSDMGQAAAEPAKPAPDTSHLKLAD